MNWTRTLTIASMLLWGTACPFVGSRTYNDEVKDYDGDGVVAVRFGGDDCRDNDASVLRCDFDGDGFDSARLGGLDCDDEDAAIHPDAGERCNDIDDDCDGLVDDEDPDDKASAPTWYADLDQDGYGDPDDTVSACFAPSGYISDARDCDDGRDDVYPGAPEFCDDIDRDCTGDPRDAVDQLDYYPDEDGDGYGRALADGEEVLKACDDVPGFAPNTDDCNDADGTVYPGATDTWYDGVDSNCDGASDYDQDGDGQDAQDHGGVDCNDTNAAINRNAIERCDNGIDNDCDGLADDADHNENPVDSSEQLSYFYDGDGDLYGGIEQAYCVDKAPDGWLLQGGDCNDSRPDIAPGTTEICDDIDNNCNGSVDDNAVDALPYFQDSDGDAFGSIQVFACELGPGLAAVDGDCNDADAGVNPDAPEICGDDIRQDCSTVYSVDDCDSDGFESTDAGGSDCDDTRADINPTGQEVCNGLDDDCDGDLDDADATLDASTRAPLYTDDDLDGYGTSPLVLAEACTPLPGTALNNTDCNDNDGRVYPGAPEYCDGLANDCDEPGSVDVAPVLDAPSYHLDDDGDGFGDVGIAWATTCDPPSTGVWTLNDLDCNDDDVQINPSASEQCDGLDNDCDGLIDAADDDVDPPPWFADADGDGWGVATDVLRACTQPVGYVAGAGDCNDFDDTTNPAADEVCDSGADNDCDGLADDADPDLASAILWYEDDDLDGFGNAGVTMSQCGQPPNFVQNDNDCDDSDSSVNPSAVESCDSVDNDCDGDIDDDDPSVANRPLWFADSDGDGWGSSASGESTRACELPAGYLPQSGDCDDANSDTNPSADEVCDSVDNDCDGAIDDADSNVLGDPWYPDADNDGVGTPSGIIYQCNNPGGGWTEVIGNDCDDGNNSVYPGAPEVCDGADNDCDARIDEDDPGLVGGTTYYLDSDADGHGDYRFTIRVCGTVPDGYSTLDDDCADYAPTAYPGNTEVCDGLDNDCNGFIDDGTTGVTLWRDLDNDGWGDNDDSIVSCGLQPGYIDFSGDCNDNDPSVNPGAFEDCDNTVDRDCDGDFDDGFYLDQWEDNDNDGYGNGSLGSIYECGLQSGYADNPDDCDDNDGGVYPGNGCGSIGCHNTLFVDGGSTGYNDIAEAVNEACDNALIEVAAPGGPYNELIYIYDKTVHIRGVDGRPVISAGSGPAISIDGVGSGTTLLENLEFQDTDNTGGLGGAVAVYGNASVELIDSVISGTRADQGSAVYVSQSSLIVRNTLVQFTEDQYGSTFYCDNGDVQLEDINIYSTNSGVLYAYGCSVSVKNLEAREALPNQLYPAFEINDSDIDMTDVDLGSSTGMYFWGSSGPVTATLRRVRAYEIVGPAMRFDGSDLDALIENVAVANVSEETTYTLFGNGIEVHNGATLEARNITVAGIDDRAFDFVDPGNINMRDVIVTDVAGQIFFLSNAFPNIQYLMHESDLSATWSSLWHSSWVVGDAEFIAYHRNLPYYSLDLHLHNRVGRISDAVNAGSSGETNPDGTPLDIGAYGGFPADAPGWYYYWQDIDLDGLYDGWEERWWGNTTQGPSGHDDLDGLDNLSEMLMGTSPTNADTDGDGTNDMADTAPLDSKNW